MISYAGQIVRFFTYLNMFFDQNIIGRDWRQRVISDCRHDVSTIRRQFTKISLEFRNDYGIFYPDDMRYLHRVFIGSKCCLVDHKN